MAGEVERARRVAASGIALPATGHPEGAETRSEEGDAERVTTSSGLPDLERDSGVRAVSDRADLGEGGQSAPVSDQAAVLGLLWVGRGDTFERGLPISRRQGGEAQTSPDDARAESELQSSAQVRLQGCRSGWNPPGPIRRLLCPAAGEGDPTGNGSADAGEKESGGNVDLVEGRGGGR